MYRNEMIIAKDKRVPTLPTPPGPARGNFQPKKRKIPEQKTQKTHSSFSVNLKPYLRIKSELTAI